MKTSVVREFRTCENISKGTDDYVDASSIEIKDMGTQNGGQAPNQQGMPEKQ